MQFEISQGCSVVHLKLTTGKSYENVRFTKCFVHYVKLHLELYKWQSSSGRSRGPTTILSTLSYYNLH